MILPAATAFPNALVLLAQADGGEGPPPSFFDGPTLLIFTALIVIFYLLVIRPGNKDRQKKEEERASIKKGSKVITIGGIHGKVTDASQSDTVEVEIAKNTRIRVNRTAIAQVDPEKPIEAADKDKKAEASDVKEKKA